MGYGDVDSPFVAPDAPVIHEVPKREVPKPGWNLEKHLQAVADKVQEELVRSIPQAYLEYKVIPGNDLKPIQNIDQKVRCFNCGAVIYSHLPNCACGYPTNRSFAEWAKKTKYWG